MCLVAFQPPSQRETQTESIDRFRNKTLKQTPKRIPSKYSIPIGPLTPPVSFLFLSPSILSLNKDIVPPYHALGSPVASILHEYQTSQHQSPDETPTVETF